MASTKNEYCPKRFGFLWRTHKWERDAYIDPKIDWYVKDCKRCPVKSMQMPVWATYEGY